MNDPQEVATKRADKLRRKNEAEMLEQKKRSHKQGCGADIFGEKTCTCVHRWSPQAKLEECGNYTGDMYQDHRGGFVKFSDHQAAIREAILETRKQTQWIPVSERLPEWEGRYLIQYRQHGQVRVFVADYYPTEGWASRMADMEILQWSEIHEPPQLAELSSPAASKPQDATATNAARKETE